MFQHALVTFLVTLFAPFKDALEGELGGIRVARLARSNLGDCGFCDLPGHGEEDGFPLVVAHELLLSGVENVRSSGLW
jgi:hypothetical protein